MRISEDKLPPAIGLGRAVPNGRKCKSRAKGELRDPGDKVRRDAVAELLACSEPGRNGREKPFAQVVAALDPWWKRNQDSTLPEVLADLIAPRSPEPEIDRLRMELRESRAEVSRLRDALKSAEAEADGMRRKLEKVSFLIKDDVERSR